MGDVPAGLERHTQHKALRKAWGQIVEDKALGLVLEPAFTDGYPAALERLGQSTFFTDPASVTWFIRNWSRVLAGEFDGRIQRRGKPKAKAFQLEEGAT